MREPLYCQICLLPLFNGLDTYGEQGEERCFHCHFDTGLTDLPALFLHQDYMVYEFEAAKEDFLRSIGSAEFRMKYAVERQDVATVKAVQEEIHNYEMQFEPYRRAQAKASAPYEKALWWEQWRRDVTVQR